MKLSTILLADDDNYLNISENRIAFNQNLKSIQEIPNVISAEMVFACSEDELELAREELEKAKDNIPEWLNDPDAKMRDIKYGGDLKGKY